MLNGDQLNYRKSRRRLKIRTRFCFGFIAASVSFFSSFVPWIWPKVRRIQIFSAKQRTGDESHWEKCFSSVSSNHSGERIKIRKFQRSEVDAVLAVGKVWGCRKWRGAPSKVRFLARFRMMTGPEDDSRRWSINFNPLTSNSSLAIY